MLLVEKTDQVGGIGLGAEHAARPAWRGQLRKGAWLSAPCRGNGLDEDRAAAFLRAAPEMIDFLEDHSPVELRSYPYHPDHLATQEGTTLSGRVLELVPCDGAVLGRGFARSGPESRRAALPSARMDFSGIRR